MVIFLRYAYLLGGPKSRKYSFLLLRMLQVDVVQLFQCSWTGNSSFVSQGTWGSPILCHCLCSHRNIWLFDLLSSGSQAKFASNRWLNHHQLVDLISYLYIYKDLISYLYIYKLLMTLANYKNASYLIIYSLFLFLD